MLLFLSGLLPAAADARERQLWVNHIRAVAELYTEKATDQGNVSSSASFFPLQLKNLWQYCSMNRILSVIRLKSMSI